MDTRKGLITRVPDKKIIICSKHRVIQKFIVSLQ